jgi:hypothetical protein
MCVRYGSSVSSSMSLFSCCNILVECLCVATAAKVLFSLTTCQKNVSELHMYKKVAWYSETINIPLRFKYSPIKGMNMNIS